MGISLPSDGGGGKRYYGGSKKEEESVSTPAVKELGWKYGGSTMPR